MSTQLVKLPAGRRRFGEYPGNDIDCHGNAWGIPTAAKAYEDGWWTGVAWDHRKYDYTPGGPWVHSFQERYKNNHPRDWQDLKAYCDATIENHEEWMRGWHDGCQMEWKPPELFVDHIAVLGYN